MVPPEMTRTAGATRHRASRARRGASTQHDGTRPHRLPAMSHRIPLRLDRSIVRMALSLGLVSSLVLGGAAAVRPARVIASGPLETTSVSGSPFKGSGSRDHVTLMVDLAEAADLTVRVIDFQGHRVRTLVDHRLTGAGPSQVEWDGRDTGGHLVADGPYRFRSTATTGTDTLTVSDWVTKAPHVPYAVRPGAIVVAINPGHGGSDPGATVGGTMEKDMNLAISLRLRRMLEGAGIGVVMTRSTDVDVNRPATDRNGDGTITHQDELVARNDVADIARADLVVNIHNNATACRCGQGTEVFVNRKRPWSAANLVLGKAIQAAFIRRLKAFESVSWKVHDNGIGDGGRYYSLRPANAAGPRPALMPAILGESLYLDRPAERAKLRDPRVQTALAAGYFDGISHFLATRRFGIRYTAIHAPDQVPAGGHGTVQLRIRNTGNVDSSGWRIQARLVRRVPVLDGSGARGTLVGSLALPDGIGPGQAVDVQVPFTMPASVHRWLLKLDIVRSAGRLSDEGVAQPQLPIATVTAP